MQAVGAISAALSSGTLGFGATVLLQHRSPLEGIGHRGTCTNTSVGASGMQRPLHGLQCSSVVGRKSKKKGSVGCVGKKGARQAPLQLLTGTAVIMLKGLGPLGALWERNHKPSFQTSCFTPAVCVQNELDRCPLHALVYVKQRKESQGKSCGVLLEMDSSSVFLT